MARATLLLAACAALVLASMPVVTPASSLYSLQVESMESTPSLAAPLWARVTANTARSAAIGIPGGQPRVAVATMIPPNTTARFLITVAPSSFGYVSVLVNLGNETRATNGFSLLQCATSSGSTSKAACSGPSQQPAFASDSTGAVKDIYIANIDGGASRNVILQVRRAFVALPSLLQ